MLTFVERVVPVETAKVATNVNASEATNSTSKKQVAKESILAEKTKKPAT